MTVPHMWGELIERRVAQYRRSQRALEGGLVESNTLTPIRRS
jgi:hypothetical protein